MRKWLTDVCKQEIDEFGPAPGHFTYPRTMNALRALFKHSLESLEAVAGHLPRKARGNYRASVKNLTPILARFPELTTAEIISASLAARAAKKGQ